MDVATINFKLNYQLTKGSLHGKASKLKYQLTKRVTPWKKHHDYRNHQLKGDIPHALKRAF
jgi:hypothetical protein